MLELKSTISKIIRNFHISVDADFKPKVFLGLIIKSANGIVLKLDDRK